MKVVEAITGRGTLPARVLLLLAAIVLCPRISSAQGCFVQECPAGTPRAGHTVSCQPSYQALLAACGVRDAQPAGPTAAELEAARRKREETERIERERKEAEERQRALDEQRKAAAFKSDRDRAFTTLKDTAGPSGGALKDAPAGAHSDLKTIDPSKEINTTAPDQGSRTLTTSREQIHCAAEILLKAASRFSSNSGRDDDTIVYLAGEAQNALINNPVGVACDPTPPDFLKFGRAPKSVASDLQHLATRLSDDAKRLKRIQAGERVQPGVTQQSAARASAPPATAAATAAREPSAPSSDEDARIARAAAEQRANELKQEEAIKQVYDQQKKNEDAQDAALALLRASQQQLNDVNSQKIAAEKDIEDVQAQVRTLLTNGTEK